MDHYCPQGHHIAETVVSRKFILVGVSHTLQIKNELCSVYAALTVLTLKEQLTDARQVRDPVSGCTPHGCELAADVSPRLYTVADCSRSPPLGHAIAPRGSGTTVPSLTGCCSPMAAAICSLIMSAARFSGSASRCAYRCVVEACAWPSSLPMTGSPKLAPAPTLA